MPEKIDGHPKQSSVNMVGPFVAELGNEGAGFESQKFMTLVLSSLASDPSELDFNMGRFARHYPNRPKNPEDEIQSIIRIDKPKLGIRTYRAYAGALAIFSDAIDYDSRRDKPINPEEYDKVIDFEDETNVGAEPVDWKRLRKNPFDDGIKLLAMAHNLPAAIALPAEDRGSCLESEIDGFDPIARRILEKTAQFLCAPQRALTRATIHKLEPGEMPSIPERSPIGRSIQQQFGDALSKHGFYIEVVSRGRKGEVVERLGYPEPSVDVQEV